MTEVPPEEEMTPRFQTSLPKSGTHLISHICRTDWFVRDESLDFGFVRPDGSTAKFNASPDRRHIQGHLAYVPEWEEFLVGRVGYCLIRDPRDTIVSWYYYLSKVDDNHVMSHMDIGLDLKGAEDRMMAIIENIAPFFRGFFPWLYHPNMFTIRYEELLLRPELALMDLAGALGEPLEYLVERSKFRGSRAFRKGEPGNWEYEFSPQHKEVFNAKWRDVLREFGYV